MTDTRELIQFLRARLNEEADRAVAAPPGPWNTDASGSITAADGTKVIYSLGGTVNGRTSRWPEKPVVDVLTTWHPKRAVRDIAADQQTLRELEEAELTLAAAEPGTPPHHLMTGAVSTLRRIAHRMADRYADHASNGGQP